MRKIGLLGLLPLVALAQSASIYMWGGSGAVNAYMDEHIIPALKQKEGIELKRVPIEDPKTILRKIQMEKSAGKNGDADVLWINGENFKLAKDLGLLYGPFLENLPNYKNYIDANDKTLHVDFGEPIDGLEAPFGRAQLVLVYDSAKTPNPPRGLDELVHWSKENPNLFTYPLLPDFTASALVRAFWMQEKGNDGFKEDVIKNQSQDFWAKLKALKPYMYNGGFQPANIAMQDVLFGKGDVAFTFTYHPSSVVNKINSGDFPASTRIATFKGASIANTHYMAIPITSSKPQTAQKVINFLLSPTAQGLKQDPSIWGDDTVLELSRLSSKERENFNFSHPALLPQSELAKDAIGEMDAALIEIMEELWEAHVLK